MSEQSILAGASAQRLNHDQEARRHPAPSDKEREITAQAGSLEEHYASVIGVFQDDPMLDAMMANIQERRRELDADDLTE